MEKDYALEQQDKEALRAYVKHHNARTEGRVLPEYYLKNEDFLRNEVSVLDEMNQLQQMKALKESLLSNMRSGTGIFESPIRNPKKGYISGAFVKDNLSDEVGQFEASVNKKMRPGIFEQMREAGKIGNTYGKPIFYGTSGEGYTAGFDPYEEEPETLEDLKAQLNFNLVADIISIEKR